MPVVYSCIMPHGTDLIPKLSKNERTTKKFSSARDGMHLVAQQMHDTKPDTIVIATPHNFRIWKKIAISFAENSSGFLQSDSRTKIRIGLSVKSNTKFAREIYGRAIDKKLAIVGVNYGTFEGAMSDLPMDWGTMVPLWFLMNHNLSRKEKILKPRVVVIAPSREIPLSQNITLGKEIAKLADEQTERVAFVASADQAHTHQESGPYGYHPGANKFDEIAVEAVKENNLAPLFHLTPELIEDAKPDSIWQLAILHGVNVESNFKSRILSYDVPTYFGMICASYTPAG